MVDARCLDDLDLFGEELDDPLEELYQDLYHRLIEPPGSNLDDPARGYGLATRLSGSGRKAELPSTIKHGIEGEFRKDNRVHDCRADVTETAPGEYAIAIAIDADEGALRIRLEASATGVRRVV